MSRWKYFKEMCAVLTVLLLVLFAIHVDDITPLAKEERKVDELPAMRPFYENSAGGIKYQLGHLYHGSYNSTREPLHAHVSVERKLLFIHVPFTDPKRIETTFLFEDSRNADDHLVEGRYKIRDFDNEFVRNYYKFAVVRHPCSRLVAAWNFFSRGLRNAGDEVWAEEKMADETLTSFDAFVERVLFPGGPVHVEQNIHLQTQVGMIFDGDGKFGLDQLLVFERWNESVAQLAKSLNEDLSALAMVPLEQESCSEMYTSITWEKLNKIYALDFCVLGYSTDIDENSSVPIPISETSDMTRRFADCFSKIGNAETQAVSLVDRQSPVTVSEWNDPCVIYTYYSELKTDYKSSEKRAVDRRTIGIWKKWWASAGWKPRVLNEEDAKRHPQYHELRDKFLALPTVNAKDYEVACFMRYAAMAAVGGGWMTDFDLIPLNMPPCLEPLYGGDLTIYQTFVPALVSGRSSEYTRIANRLANVDYKKDPEIFTYGNKPHVSDMLAMKAFLREGAFHALESVIEANEMFQEAPVCESHAQFERIPEGFPKKPWTIHFSHEAIRTIRKGSINKTAIWPGSSWNSKRLSTNIGLIRAEFMKDCIKYIFDLCHLGGGGRGGGR